jgi:hypothetical protein
VFHSGNAVWRRRKLRKAFDAIVLHRDTSSSPSSYPEMIWSSTRLAGHQADALVGEAIRNM